MDKKTIWNHSWPPADLFLSENHANETKGWQTAQKLIHVSLASKKLRKATAKKTSNVVGTGLVLAYIFLYFET